MKQKIELGPDEASIAVREYLERQGFQVIGKPSASVEQEMTGYGTGEHYEPVFRGFKADVESKATSRKSDA